MSYVFVSPTASYRLPPSFDFSAYIEIERELWALFPETDSNRCNINQEGLTAWLYVETADIGPFGDNETFFLLPNSNGMMQPLRMKRVRRLTLDEFRLAYLTARKLSDLLKPAQQTFETVNLAILGPEIAGSGE